MIFLLGSCKGLMRAQRETHKNLSLSFSLSLSANGTILQNKKATLIKISIIAEDYYQDVILIASNRHFHVTFISLVTIAKEWTGTRKRSLIHSKELEDGTVS